MTAGEKGNFCGLMAALFAPPEREMIGHVHKGGVYSLLENYLKPRGGEAAILTGFKAESEPEALLGDLQNEYRRLLSGPGNPVSLIESVHKSWTLDPECHLPFAREKGLIMGDPALHMAAIFQHWGVEVAEEFKACPDHLVLELEFLSALYEGGTDREIKQFIADHLDWVPQLKEELIGSHPHPFYISAVEVLDFFLTQERERLEIKENGKKSVP